MRTKKVDAIAGMTKNYNLQVVHPIPLLLKQNTLNILSPFYVF